MAAKECTYEKTFYLKKPKILTFFGSDDGKSVVNFLQDQEGCTIVVKECKTAHVNLSFLKEQITEVADDVIVSSIGQNLDMRTGQLSRYILMAAGREIEEESRQNCPAGLSVAEIVETSGGRLKCKAIYHCCLPHWKSKKCMPDEVLRQVARDCIIKASTQGYKSIAFPALGSGSLGYPKYVTAAAIIDTVREFDYVPLSLVDGHVVGLPEDPDFEEDFKEHHATLANKLFDQGSNIQGLSKAFKKFYRRHVEGISKFDVSVTKMMSGAIPYFDLYHTFPNYFSFTPHEKTFYLKKPKILTFFESDEGKSVMNSLQDQGGCTIVVKECKTDTITIGKLTLVLLEGEITDDCADVIVHPTTKQLSFDSGDVSTSLRLKCGTGFVEECQVEDFRKCGMVLSTAPRLQCKTILHTKHFGSWKKTVKKCIKHVDETNKYRSIAFPAVPPDMLRGSLAGVYQNAALEMVEAVAKVHTKTVKSIRVFCPDESKLDTYEDAVFSSISAIPDLSTKAGRWMSRVKALKRGSSKTPTEDDILETGCHRVLTKPPMPAAECPSRNESVASVTVSCQENKCDEIYKKLADRCDEDYTRKVVDQRIQKLTSSQTEDLVAFAKKESVDVTTLKDSGEVHLKGPFHILTKVSYHLDEILQTVADLGFVAYPICWERVESGQRVFDVAEGSTEYMGVKDSFMRDLGENGYSATIFKIKRIQIPHLYRQYQIEMQTVQTEHPSKDNERIMWHGTDVEAVPNINKYGFNRSYSGKNATLYGQGVYFAVNAIISSMDKYSPPDTSGIKYVYRARVLTGRYTKGDAKMRDPPLVDPIGSVRYTSTTDNTSRPSLFCIFRDTHSYPEYLISFQLRVPQTP